MLLAWCGFFVSWVYLRFYRMSPSLFAVGTGPASGGTELGSGLPVQSSTEVMKGDASDTFAFAAFWPDVVQPPIAAFSDMVYALAVAVHVITPFSAADVDAGNDQASAREGGTELPSLMHAGKGARGEAERRRALALRALDQRLTAHASAGQGRAQPMRIVHEPLVARVETDTREGEEDLSRPSGADEKTDAEGVENGIGEV